MENKLTMDPDVDPGVCFCLFIFTITQLRILHFQLHIYLKYTLNYFPFWEGFVISDGYL